MALPFAVNFFGTMRSSLYVNNNGNVTFGSPLGDFTPTSLGGSSGLSIIAPFWADVDTSNAGSAVVTYGATTVDGRQAFCVMWDGVGVGYFDAHIDKLNKFQLLLKDRSDVAPGDFDIIFNYDQVQWETGDASDGSGGIGGDPARVGYSNGSTRSFELPGSGVSLAFLDSNTTTGLIHNRTPVGNPLGRYTYPIRNGEPPTGGTLAGRVFANSAATPLSGAFVQACGGGGFCNTTSTNATGQYSIAGLTSGSYNLRVFPPSGSALGTATAGPIAIPASGTVTAPNIVLTGPMPIPAGTTITSHGAPGGVPLVYWGEPLTLRTSGCPGGNATYQMLQNGGLIRSGTMTAGPPGTYTATIAALSPLHGAARVVITIVCPGAPTVTIPFDIYIDPSGTVRSTTGAPIAGATVTLYRADDAAGPFTAVLDGSGIMSPANRSNPDTTDGAGHFGWDVLAGFYRVRASAPGCHAPSNPSTSFVETAVLTIPPPVTDLEIVLECAARADLTVSKELKPGQPAARAGGTLYYLVRVQNTGNQATPPPPNTVTLIDTPPAGTSVASWSITRGSGRCSSDGAGRLVCDLGANWGSGAETIVEVVIRTPRAGSLTNTAEVDPYNKIIERDEGNNRATLVTLVPATPDGPRIGVNLLQNASFESGSAGWILQTDNAGYPLLLQGTRYRTGVRALELPPMPGSPPFIAREAQSAMFDVLASGTYRLSFYGYASEAATLLWQVSYYAADGTRSCTSSDGKVSLGGTFPVEASAPEWRSYSFAVGPFPACASKVNIGVQQGNFLGTNPATSVYLDDFAFTRTQ